MMKTILAGLAMALHVVVRATAQTPSAKPESESKQAEISRALAAGPADALWFDSPAAMEQAMNSPMAAAVKDAERFLDMERTYALAVDEKTIFNAPE
jgi:hypothetical protein